MPLTELLRMISGRVDSNQERASNSSDPSPRPEADFHELVWENGHVMMQGQSSKNGNQSLMHKSQDGRDANRLKTNNFSTIDSLLCDYPSVVPSSDMGLGHDGDMVPWLSFPDAYACDFMPELSGVTLNNIAPDNHLTDREKNNLKHRDASKVDSNAVKCGKGQNSEVPQFGPSSQSIVPRSGVSGVTGDNAGNTINVASRDFNSSSLCAFTSLRLQKLDAGQPSTSSSFANFPYFSRSAALAKANHLSENTSKRLENNEQRCTMTGSNPVDSTLVNLARSCSWKELGTQNPSVQAPVGENPELLKKQSVELITAKRVTHREDVINDNQHNHALDATTSKVGPIGERNVVPAVAASSVCSGNSVDKASNVRGNDLKRKLRETTESEGPSEEVEDESVGAKKAAHARVSSKRIRAAEVHNLSERRRRDRINEKMRALQELIPNCNKVDKASMLDEAIEYLKTLQIQLQMFSMGAGLYMQPMMLPPGMQPIHGAQIPHFSPMGLGMGMGYGMNMLDVNGGMKMLPFQSPHYPVPGAVAPFHGIPSSSLQPFGHPSQGFQMSMPRASAHPIPAPPPPNVLPIGLNVSGVAGSLGASNVSPPLPQVIPGNGPNIYMNQATNQATKESNQQSASSHDRIQAVNASGTSLDAPGRDNAVA